jgi:hypothetical protein
VGQTVNYETVWIIIQRVIERAVEQVIVPTVDGHEDSGEVVEIPVFENCRFFSQVRASPSDGNAAYPIRSAFGTGFSSSSPNDPVLPSLTFT